MPFELRSYSKRPNVFRLHKTGSMTPFPPGMLTYKLEIDELRNIDTCVAQPVGDEEIWTKMHCDDITKLRMLPKTQKESDWRLVFVMKRIDTDGTIWLKGAMKNDKTGKMALITSANTSDAILRRGNRAIKSHDELYHVGQYAMLAPLTFWNELKTALIGDM